MCVRSVWVSSAYAGPQTSESSMRCVGRRQDGVRERAAAVGHEGAQQVELDRGQVDLRAIPPDDARRQVDLEPVDGDRRLARGPAGAGQARLKPGDELARAEGLRDVVVGARLERAHLLV